MIGAGITADEDESKVNRLDHSVTVTLEPSESHMTDRQDLVRPLESARTRVTSSSSS